MKHRLRPSGTSARSSSPQRRGEKQKRRIVLALILLLLAGILLAIGLQTRGQQSIENPKVARLSKLMIPDWIQVQLIPKNADSRRGELLEDFNHIVIHYVGNPGTSAAQNQKYFTNPGTQVNAHFLIGLEGEILQCLPLEEKSSATSERNRDTISIEVCHPDEEGRFTRESYDALLRLTGWLCVAMQVDETAVIRHYDATGKECPLYYVRNEESWLQFQSELAQEIARQIREMTGLPAR